MKTLFLANLTTAYNKVFMTFRSKVLVRTSSSLEKPILFGYFRQFYNFRVFLTEMIKKHIYTSTSTPESVRPSVQKFWPVQKKYEYDGQIDGWTPQTYRPKTFWVRA